MSDTDINKRSIESLRKAGAFDSLDLNRRQMLNYEEILDGIHDQLKQQVEGRWTYLGMRLKGKIQHKICRC